MRKKLKIIIFDCYTHVGAAFSRDFSCIKSF